MNPTKNKLLDLCFLIISAVFLFGCFTSFNRSAQTLESGEAQFSADYFHAIPAEGSGDPMKLLNTDIRIGVSKGVELGLVGHTFDFSEHNQLGSYWLDGKFQLTNYENKLMKPILSTGLIKGFIYNMEDHVIGLPVYFGVRLTPSITLNALFRYELLSSDIIPEKESFENPRYSAAINTNLNLNSDNKSKFNTDLLFSLGWFNATTGSRDGTDGIVLNLGLAIRYNPNR